MLKAEALRDLLAGDMKPQDRLLILLAVDVDQPKVVNKLKTLARGAGWRGIDKVNVSLVLSRTKGLAARTSGGWELTSKGRAHVAALTGQGTPVATVAPALRALLPKIANADARAFVEEAVSCFEYRLYRAAVVLSWAGAVRILYDHVLANYLAAFNAEATKRANNPKEPWKPAKNADDLARMNEAAFLDILPVISVTGVGKNVKTELKNALDRRNACGHPNTYQLGEHTVAHHLETLILNVYSKF